MSSRIDVNVGPFDQSTFFGRLKYYFWITDPRLTLVSTERLNQSRELLDKYRRNEEPPGTTEHDVRVAQKQYFSAFHPDSGQLQNVFGRMSFQVPGGMVLIGAMITFYKSTPAVVFWQWANQSFNALVNYTNSNASNPVNKKQMAVAYISATSSALVVALGLKRGLANNPNKLLQRFVPWAAVASANAVNIPLMRQSELSDGVVVTDEAGKDVTKSRYAAVKGIPQVVTSRIFIASPSMIFLPIIMKRVDKTPLFKRYGALSAISQVLFAGCFLLFTVPIGCSLFPQRCSVPSSRLSLLDNQKVEELRKEGRMTLPTTLYFNKGL